MNDRWHECSSAPPDFVDLRAGCHSHRVAVPEGKKNGNCQLTNEEYLEIGFPERSRPECRIVDTVNDQSRFSG
jgi:hypothetical protein